MEIRHEVRLRVDTKSIESRHRMPDAETGRRLGSWDEVGGYVLSGVAELRRLADALCALGLESSVELAGANSILTIRYPSPTDAARMAKRGGRVRTQLPYGSPLYALTASEAIAWLDEHTQVEREEALGVSRASCYRRMRELREIAERNPATRLWALIDGRHR